MGALGVAALTGILWAAAPFAAAGGGCMHGTPATDGAGTTIAMVDNCFTPTILHAARGDTITFVNRDGWAHTVTGVGGTWGTLDQLAGGAKVSYTFDQNGVYVFVCFIHPGMAGAIVVGDGSGSAGLEPASVEAVDPGIPPSVAVSEPSSSGGTIGLALSVLIGLSAIALALGTLSIYRSRRAHSST
jgi:plastocyanin